MDQKAPPRPELVLRLFVEMKHIQRRFPFGKSLSESIIERYSKLCMRLQGGLPKLPHDSSLMLRCVQAHTAFRQWAELTRLTWLSNQCEIRTAMVRLLNPRSAKPDDFTQWRVEVFTCIKKVVSQWKRQKDNNVELVEGQVCVDTLFEFQVQDYDLSANLQSAFRLYLLDTCQRTTLSPTSFIVQGIQISTDRPALENGASASVFHGYHGQAEVAIKSFRLYTNTIKKVKRHFAKEALILQLLQHPNIVPFAGIIVERSRLCIISEWMQHGHIIEYLQRYPSAPRKELLERIADALHFLSQYNIVHGDLKGENILIDINEKARISDFGLSAIQPRDIVPRPPTEVPMSLAHCEEQLKRVGLPGSLGMKLSSLSSRSCAGTWRWMSPERLDPELFGRGSAKATLQSDVFAFGLLIYQVYSGLQPFNDDNEQMAILSIITGRRPSRPTTIPLADELWELAEQCWSASATTRPDIWDVYNRLAVMECP